MISEAWCYTDDVTQILYVGVLFLINFVYNKEITLQTTNLREGNDPVKSRNIKIMGDRLFPPTKCTTGV